MPSKLTVEGSNPFRPAKTGVSMAENKNNKKLKVGFFSMTCDEGCMIEVLEIMNEKFFEWKDQLDYKHFRLLQTKNQVKDIDVAFVEGAIATFEEEKTIKEIRANSKRVVALGSCAINGSPSNHRNFFDEKTLAEIKPILEKFGHRDKIVPLKELIKVDAEVSGCPIVDQEFLRVLENYLKEFGVR